MLAEVRKELDRIEEFLLQGGQAGDELWSVLSALRGYDTDSFEDELETKKDRVIAVRRAAFPRIAKERERDRLGAFGGLGQLGGATFGRAPATYRKESTAGSDHFRSHADKAAVVLGLIEVSPVDAVAVGLRWYR